MNRASDCGEQLQFHPPVPHLDLRLLAQVAPEQVWLGMEPLQIAADRDRLGEIRPVVELQHRHSVGRVLRQEFGPAALTSENVDILHSKLDSPFRREDADPARIWSEGMTVKLHTTCHFDTLQNTSSFLISRARLRDIVLRGSRRQPANADASRANALRRVDNRYEPPMHLVLGLRKIASNDSKMLISAGEA